MHHDRSHNARASHARALVVFTAALVAIGGASVSASGTDPTPTGDTGITGITGPEPTPTECPSDSPAGQLTYANSISFTRGLDPIVALGRANAGGTENTAFYDTLLRYDPDTGAAVPHVAESLVPNDDFTQWTLTLRPGITFGNGDPLTAEAVEFSLERLAASSVGTSAMAAEIETITIVDDLTLTLDLRRPWAGIDYFFTAEGGMVVNPRVVEERGDQFAADPTGAGVGAFELERFAPGEEIVLRAKDDYWGGPVCLDTLRFISIPGAQATYDAFQTGEIDAYYIQDARAVADTRADGHEYYEIDVAGSRGLLLNQGVRGTTSPMTDVRLRQAVAAAIDLDAINDRVFDGVGIASSAVFLESEVAGPSYDPERAQELVAEAMADGFDGNVRLTCSNSPEETELSIALQAYLEAAGFIVERENLPQADTNTRLLVEPDYDIGCSGLSVPAYGAFSSVNQWESTSTRNRVGYVNEDMDAAIVGLMTAQTADEVGAAQDAVQTVWNETIPSMMIFGQEWLTGWSDSVDGLLFTRDAIPLFYAASIES